MLRVPPAAPVRRWLATLLTLASPIAGSHCLLPPAASGEESWRLSDQPARSNGLSAEELANTLPAQEELWDWAGPVRWDEVNAGVDFDAIQDAPLVGEVWSHEQADLFWHDASSVHGEAHPTFCPQTGISRHPGKPRKPHRELPGDVNRGDCPPLRYRMDDHERAGWPHWVSRWAQPSLSRRDSAWYVGGGAAFGGRGPCPGEGVWGLDYQGVLPGRRIWLGWTGGRKQGGEGVYQTDGLVSPTRPFHRDR